MLHNLALGKFQQDFMMCTCIHGVQLGKDALSHLVQQRSGMMHHVGKGRHHICQVTRQEAVHLHMFTALLLSLLQQRCCNPHSNIIGTGAAQLLHLLQPGCWTVLALHLMKKVLHRSQAAPRCRCVFTSYGVLTAPIRATYCSMSWLPCECYVQPAASRCCEGQTQEDD